MMKKNVVYYAGLAVLLAFIVVLSGCGQKETSVQREGGEKKLTTENITYILSLSENSAQSIRPDSPTLQELYRKTGVKVELLITSQNDYPTKMATLFASGNLPDFFDAFGDLQEQVDAKAVLPLKELVNQYAPAMKKDLETIANLDRSFINGEYYYLPQIRRDENLEKGCVPFMRTDLLRKNNLKIPNTWLEFKDSMKKLKTIYPDKIMYSARGDNRLIGIDKLSLVRSLGGEYDLYPDKEVWKFGRTESGYKETVEFLKNLYDEKILDPEYLTKNLQALQEGAASGNVLFWYDNPTFVPAINQILATTDPEAKFEPLPFLENWHDERANYKQPDHYFSVWGISSKIKNPEVAIKLWNWFYDTEGTYLFNYGIEGDSYTIVDGNPQFTQKTLDTYLSMDNPYYAVQSAYGLGDLFFTPSWLNLSKNIFRGESKPGSIDASYIHEFYKDDPAIMELPVLPPLTTEESTKITEIRRNLDDYSRSEINKFIMGKRPFNEWDVFVREMKNRGSDDLAVIVNIAEQRHLTQK